MKTVPDVDYWGSIVGDCLANAFSALDHAICARSTLSSCEGLGFPIFHSEAEWKQPWKKDSAKTVVEHLTRGIDPAVVARIKELQPFPGRDQSIWTLKRLANEDKHRAIHVVALATHLTDIKPVGDPPMPSVELLYARNFAFEDDAIAAGFRLRVAGELTDVEVHMNASFAADICFGQETPEVPGKEVMGMLEELLSILVAWSPSVDATPRASSDDR